MVLADTGPLYALADPSDQYHLQAQDQLEQITAAKKYLAVTYPTVAESYTLVVRRLGVSYAHQWLEQLMDGSTLINPEPADYIQAAALMFRFKGRTITFFDGLTAILSERMRVVVWTFDSDFEMLGIKRWT